MRSFSSSDILQRQSQTTCFAIECAILIICCRRFLIVVWIHSRDRFKTTPSPRENILVFSPGYKRTPPDFLKSVPDTRVPDKVLWIDDIIQKPSVA